MKEYYDTIEQYQNSLKADHSEYSNTNDYFIRVFGSHHACRARSEINPLYLVFKINYMLLDLNLDTECLFFPDDIEKDDQYLDDWPFYIDTPLTMMQIKNGYYATYDGDVYKVARLLQIKEILEDHKKWEKRRSVRIAHGILIKNYEQRTN